MKDWLINVLAKFGGVGKIWSFLDGKKAYGTGGLAIVGALGGLGAKLAPILAAHDTAALVNFLININSDPAYLALLGGFALIAGAHKADKIIEAKADAPK